MMLIKQKCAIDGVQMRCSLYTSVESVKYGEMCKLMSFLLVVIIFVGIFPVFIKISTFP